MSDLALRILLSASDTASSVIKSVGGSLQNMGGSASGVQAGMLEAAGGAAVLMGAILSTIPPAAQFQQSMLKIQAYAGLSKTQMDSMSQSLLDMSAAVGVGPKELADALYPIVSSGYNAADALNILKLSAETAAASGAKTSVVADALTTSLGAMHAPASDAAHYMDMLNKIVSIGKGEVPQYAAVIGKLSLAAAGAGVDFATSGAALADLTTHGFPSVAQASTSLGNLFTQIGVKTDALAQHAKKAGVAFDAHKFATMSLADKLDYLQKITGGNQGELLKLVGGSTVALKAFNALEGGSKDLRSNLDAMKNSTGATDAAFKTASSGFNASMNRMQAAVEVLQVRIGSALLPALTSLVDKIAPVISRFADWVTKSGIIQTTATLLGNAFTFIGNVLGTLGTAINNTIAFFQKHQTAMNALKAVLIGIGVAILVFAATAIPPLLIAFGAWAVAAGAAAIATLVAAAPFILVGAIVAAVAFGIIEAVQHWGEISNWLKGVWGAVSSWFMSTMHALGGFFVGVWNGILSGLKAAWNAIVTAVKVGAMLLLAAAFAPIIAVAALFIWLYQHNKYFKMLIDAIVNVFKAGIAWIQGAWTAAIAWLGGVWQGVVGIATAVWNTVTTAIKTAFNDVIKGIIIVWQYISGVFSSAYNTYIAGPLKAAWGYVSGVFSSAWNSYIAKPLSDLWNSVSKWFTDLGTGALNSGTNFITMLVSGITSGAGKIWDAVVGIAQNIWKALGFHSPAKAGPGADADKWMPNLVHMMSVDLVAGVPEIQNAVNKLAKPIALTLGVSNSAALNSLGGVNLKSSTPLAGGGSTTNNGGTTVQNFTININVPQGRIDRAGAKEIAKVVKDELSKELRGSGKLTTWTSGGAT